MIKKDAKKRLLECTVVGEPAAKQNEFTTKFVLDSNPKSGGAAKGARNGLFFKRRIFGCSRPRKTNFNQRPSNICKQLFVILVK